MAEYRKQILIGGIVALTVGIVIVVGLSYLPLGGANSTSLITISNTISEETSSSGGQSSAQTSNSSLGIRLQLLTNTSSIVEGHAIAVSASIQNLFTKENNVSAADDWALSSLPNTTSFPCPTFLYYQVYEGFYTNSNISQVSAALQVTPVYDQISCPRYTWSSYLFQPSSDQALVANGYSEANSSVMYQMITMESTGFLIGNYSKAYNASVFSTNGPLDPPPFHPGTYTLVAGNEWGQLVILHFIVLVPRIP